MNDSCFQLKTNQLYKTMSSVFSPAWVLLLELDFYLYYLSTYLFISHTAELFLMQSDLCNSVEDTRNELLNTEESSTKKELHNRTSSLLCPMLRSLKQKGFFMYNE